MSGSFHSGQGAVTLAPGGVAVGCDTLNAAGLFFVPNVDGHGLLRIAVSPERLIKAGFTPRALDESWLRDWLRGDADPCRTPFEGMQRLLPGQELRVDVDGTVRVRNLVGPDVWSPPDLDGPDAEQALIEAFDAAVADLVDGQDEVFCELSGGLDSTFMVSSLARRGEGPQSIRAFTHIPHADAVISDDQWVPSDESAAHDLAAMYAERVNWEALSNESGRGPLQMARLVSGRAWWPAFGPGNLEWMDTIRTRVAAEGGAAVWVGVHGNAAFSSPHTYARSQTPGAWRRAARRVPRYRRSGLQPTQHLQLLIEPAAPAPAADRDRYLRWLAGHTQVHAALMSPDAFAVPSIDPFRHRWVLDTAARIKPEAWQRPGMRRGLARSAGRGRVPDVVRLRDARGAQGADVWRGMYSDRHTYLDQVELLADTVAVCDSVDIVAVRAEVTSWSWGNPTPPGRAGIAQINRVLAFADFVRVMSDRLRSLPH